MSKRGYISRYLLIVKKLKTHPYSSFQEIRDYLEYQLRFLQMQDDTLHMGFSIRTFQRDIREISNVFGIDIAYSRSLKGYFISQSEMEHMNFQRMMEAFDIFHSLNLAHDLKPYIHLENKQPQGTDNLYGLLHAIKNRKRIHFAYGKFHEEDPRQRKADPYAMKEFKNRWYVIARDVDDGKTKCFALDRLSDLHITDHGFEYPAGFNVQQMFCPFFGIVSPEGMLPEEVVLSFDAHQGKYIKSLPLHHSQTVVLDNDREVQVKLKLCITYDFLQELLSHGERVKVLAPRSLAKRLQKTYAEALKHYAEKQL